jgi:phosphate transport system permease protein
VTEVNIEDRYKELGDRLLMSGRQRLRRRWSARIGRSFLVGIASCSLIALMFIFYFIIKDAIPFFRLEGITEFFTSTKWYPSREEAEFGALAIFFGSALVTLGAILVAVPMGVLAAICLSDILPFNLRQAVKPVIEMLAAIPSVVYGFFALVVFAPLLQRQGGSILEVGVWFVMGPLLGVSIVVLSDLSTARIRGRNKNVWKFIFACIMGGVGFLGLYKLAGAVSTIRIVSGTNAFNVSIILGIMALPTVVSVSEDALNAVGRELREGSYALGATRAETLLKVVVPAAKGGILAAVILGVMRALGETMVVWMASGNAASIPEPWFDFMEPIRTMTAAIAGEMGEADQITGSARYHVLFALALCLLVFAFVSDLVSEMVSGRGYRRKK